MQVVVNDDEVDEEFPNENDESTLPESLVPQANLDNEVSNVEAVPTIVRGF